MLWANPTWVGPRFSIFETVEGDGFNDLVSDAWFDHLAAITRNEMAKARLEYTRAAKHRDWAMLKSAADVLLQLEPSLYDAYYGRAQAEQQLGQTDSARATTTYSEILPQQRPLSGSTRSPPRARPRRLHQ
jgi:hypothetical protein